MNEIHDIYRVFHPIKIIPKDDFHEIKSSTYNVSKSIQVSVLVKINT